MTGQSFKADRKKMLTIALVLFVVLAGIAATVILTRGKTCIMQFDLSDMTAEEVEVIVDDDAQSVRETGRKLEGDILTLTYAAGSPGKAYILLQSGAESYIGDVLYAHKSGIITRNSFFGPCRGDLVIPIAAAIYLAFLLFLLIRGYLRRRKESIYQYRIIAILGTSVYVAFLLAVQLLQLKNYGGLIDSVQTLISTFRTFAIVTFPIALLLAILVFISNLVLVKNEGRSVWNLLGSILGILLVLGVVLPEIIGNYLQNSATFINIHDLGGQWYYLELFAETLVAQLVVYSECLLAGTIVCALKAARHIPAFDKDYIAILGCAFRPDGTLTPLLKSRVDRAIEFARMQKEATGKDIIFVPSGGQGADECMSESEAMKRYMVASGIPEEQIVMEDRSRNTFENVKFTHHLMEEKIPGGKMAFSTTNYHVLRAGAYAWKQGIRTEGIGAPTKAYFWINAFIREFIASTEAAGKRHAAVLALMVLATAALILFHYFGNNL